MLAINLAALLALYDFTGDDEIRRKAGMVLDLLLFDMALNSFKGVFGSTHGRAYENTKKIASYEGTTDASKLLFGMGVFSGFDNMSAAAFALSEYRLPRVIEEIAVRAGCHSALENKQRMGIRLAEMEKWGLHPDNFEDGMSVSRWRPISTRARSPTPFACLTSAIGGKTPFSIVSSLTSGF